MLIWFLMAIGLVIIGIIGVMGRRRYQGQAADQQHHSARKPRPSRKRRSKRK